MTSTTPGVGGAAMGNMASMGDADETVRRIKEMSDQVIEASKQNGRAWLDAYERMLDGFLKLEQQAAAGSQMEWLSQLANTQAEFIRSMSQAYVSAAREQLR